jgi:hypothetical protein
VRHRFALITFLTAVLLAGGTTAHVRQKEPGPTPAAARKVTVTLVRWPYT